jgi:hypothetical protein
MEAIKNALVNKETHEIEARPTMFKKMRARICNNCPFCNHARKNPESRIGKILHHRRHADNCPFWKAHREVYGDENVRDVAEMNSLNMWKAF